ncbi:BadF/BadG/BcrA/BcrD ATPase family protein [Rheinheimera sp. MMS21-TC3]|uniref:BadF/BadG/BcrA/BcrD ATPase family protein n=1 Tax=Rheinheimera sp. MMS21-TC3 TaxID=3072790 RepID=UPI0028C448F1|nr:BadF/BadG/BcrA/BcrD ATPase family protein [Rheinheimera sp. MMS21-TC3]WNO60043.1 BadF/BadG/BcrA/BcrD ATPase family protein [Rheinheimera sp. MMS21-TC3]
MWILALDGGGSKTLARLTNLETGQQWQQQAGPASLTNDFDLAMANINQLISQLCQVSGALPSQITAVMGLAGAANPQQHQQAETALAPLFLQLLITTDARTSLYGANLGQPIAMVAIGTGSVAMRLQSDGQEHQVGGWGFNIADEASGAWLGKMAMRKLLWQVDSKTGVQSPLLQAIADKTAATPASLLTWLKSATPADYALLAPLVFEYQNQCAIAQQLLIEHGQALSKLIYAVREDTNLPVMLLGGLASVSKPLLRSSEQALLQPAKGDSVEGAHILACQLYYRPTFNRDLP